MFIVKIIHLVVKYSELLEKVTSRSYSEISLINFMMKSSSVSNSRAHACIKITEANKGRMATKKLGVAHTVWVLFSFPSKVMFSGVKS